MAEFALGLTKTAVEGTLSRVKSAIEEEAKLKEQVQNDLVFITGEMMQSFLGVASAERAGNKVVRTWVRQVRDLAFDVEDCVEFVVHLDARSRWSWLWRVVPSSCGAPPPPLDQAVAEIRLLKARVEEVSQRTRYNLISDSGSGSASGGHKTPAVSQPSDDTAAAAAFRVLGEVWDAAGKQSAAVVGDLKTIIAREGAGLQVISLWSADLGPSRRIIGDAYGDREICQEFACHAWVKLTHPFSPKEFVTSLLTQFDAAMDEEEAPPPTAYGLMKAELAQRVSKRRYLVVVEDVPTVAEWEAIRALLQDSGNGSRIVVSTRQLGIAASCTGEPYQVAELTRFSNGQSLCVFFSKASTWKTQTFF